MSSEFLRIKKLFFDVPKIKRAVDRTTRRVLGEFGAFVWRRSRSSIRAPRKKKVTLPDGRDKVEFLPSAPGEPPRSPTKKYRKTIFFYYDPVQQTVVIGPIKKHTNAAEVLEHGGIVRIRARRKKLPQAQTGSAGGDEKTVIVQPRPHMRPAFEAEKPKLPQMWRDAVR